MRLDQIPKHPFFGIGVSLIEIDGADEGFEGVPKDLAVAKGPVGSVEDRDLAESHPKGNIIQLLAVHHLAAHLRQKTFSLVRITFEQVLGHEGTQDRIP